LNKGEHTLVDVLLTHSYHLFYDPKQVRKMLPYPPLGTLYAAALLRQYGISVAVFDSMLEDPETGFPASLRQHRPRVVAVYEDNFNFLSKMCLTRMRQVTYKMAETSKAFGASIVVNGSDSSDHVEEYLKRGADFVLLGEAEWTLLELARSLTGRVSLPPEEIRGLAFIPPDSDRVFRTPPRPLMKDIDSLPNPARDLVDIERYRQAWKSAHGFFSLNLVASRGCPYHCNWCAKPIYGQTFHVRSPEQVAAEMRELKRVYGAEHLWFADDIFGLRTNWIVELADQAERIGAEVAFKMQSRVNFMTKENVEALKRAGCQEVWMGVESGSQKILDAMEKGSRVEEIIQARQILREHGIRACYFLQFGYPGEDWQDIQMTIDLVRRTRPDDIGVSVSYPLPGTKFYDRVRAELGEKQNWVDSDDLSMMFKGSYTNEFYRLLRDALHAEVNSWRSESAQAGARNGPVAQPLLTQDGAVAALWAVVARLERTSRNNNPTIPTLLARAPAIGR
jgi:anaerobic magnesium-protoporphyrin IX monomethyl ester cyclase